jgi:hypothetical protein
LQKKHAESAEQNPDEMKITPLTILTFVFVGVAVISLGCEAPPPTGLSTNDLSNGDDDDSTAKTPSKPATHASTSPPADSSPPPAASSSGSGKKRKPPAGSSSGTSGGASGGLQDQTEDQTGLQDAVGSQDQADPGDQCFEQCIGSNAKATATIECTDEQQCQDETCADQCAQQSNCSGTCLDLLDNCSSQCFPGDDDDDTTAGP